MITKKQKKQLFEMAKEHRNFYYENETDSDEISTCFMKYVGMTDCFRVLGIIDEFFDWLYADVLPY